MSANFVSLHNHTEYSFLDGAIRIKDLVRTAKEFGMPAVAITDHGGLFGAVEFYEACKGEGIKPVLGFEAYVAPGSRLDRSQADKDKGERNYCHLILLASNAVGWKNLMRLSSIGYTEGFYMKPRIDVEVLRQCGEGIIATSACIAGAIPQAILRGEIDEAKRLTEEYISIFGEGNFYFELQDHSSRELEAHGEYKKFLAEREEYKKRITIGEDDAVEQAIGRMYKDFEDYASFIEEEKAAMGGLIKLGREMGVPFIAANDAHYLKRDDAKSHEILLCIGTQSKLSDPKRYKFSSDQIYFKSPDAMTALFPDIPEAMENTVKIAERCNVDIKIKPQLPSVDVPRGFENPEDYLTRLAHDGIKDKYADVTPALTARLDYELGIINSMGFAGYFLIVRDFVRKALDMGIMVGCRGSAAGSLTAYSIGITNVDPIKYDLIFERFLNPERISMPDADIDFADRDRQKVIDYVIEKYGRDAVCQIINFGTMKAKSAVKDVARVMEVSVSESNELSKLITEDTLKKSLEINGELSGKINNNDLFREVFKHAERLEGLTRQPGMHAGGVIIAPTATVNWAPLFRTVDKETGSEIIMTQFDMNYVEKVGLVKMDFLGLRTLTVLQESLRLISKYHGKTLDLWKLPDDEKTYALFGEGETTGVFQFESGGMKGYLRKLKPTCIEDIIAMVALYRPGPMDNIDMFINRKHGRDKIKYPHPMLEDILNVTYGVIIYQEQVMRIAQVMGGFTLGLADVLRKAMSKKQVDMMEEMGVTFMEGAAKQGINEKVAKEVFDLMAKFAGYGFNKAHAAVYAHLSYQTAYLKAHYPLEYITAYLGAYIDNQGEFVKMRDEAERMGIHMLPPDVNKSDYDFSIEDNSIRIGFGAVKNVGKAGEEILKARGVDGEFKSIFDLCKRTDNRLVNKKALESLVDAGAFDGFGATRARHFKAIPMALEYGNKYKEEQASDQVSLFGEMDGGISAPEPALPDAIQWTQMEQLQREKAVLGFYASGHPLNQYEDELKAFTTVDINDESFRWTPDGTQVTIGGLIASSDVRITQSGKNAGKKWAILNLESFGNAVKLVAYSEVYEKYGDMLEKESMILAHGTIKNDSGESPELRLESCSRLSLARNTLEAGMRSVHINLSSAAIDEDILKKIYDCCTAQNGDCYLVIHLTTADKNKFKIRSGNVSMPPKLEVLSKLRGILGKENVWTANTID